MPVWMCHWKRGRFASLMVRARSSGRRKWLPSLRLWWGIFSRWRSRSCASAWRPGPLSQWLHTALTEAGFEAVLLRDAACEGGELHGMAYQMHDAGLHHGDGKDGVDRLRKALQPSTTAMRISPMPRFLSSFMTRSQNLAPSEVAIQRPRISFVPSAMTPSAI
jgi:hypothetical protein